MKITEWNQRHVEYFPVGEGWRDLVEKMVEKVAKLSPDAYVSCCKEKFGGLRFYVDGCGEEAWKLVEEAEDESYKICEKCGTREDVTTEGGWLLTLCKTCRKNREVDHD